MLVYLAGPITEGHGFTVEDNVASAVEIYLRLSQAAIPSYCPHLTALVPAAFDVPYENWMAIDTRFVELADVMLMLPRWETSKGAVREHALALEMGKTIYYDVRDLL